MHHLSQIRSIFEMLDQQVLAKNGKPLSLHPNKKYATSFKDLGEYIIRNCTDLSLSKHIAVNLCKIISTQLRHYPENIFGDYDYFVGYILGQIKKYPEKAFELVDQITDRVVELLGLFGCETTIRFRYVHDFLYGFDWAKWVKKDYPKRWHIAPFSLEFLDSLIIRGYELRDLICQNDRKYHALSAGETYRNPFVFSREPEEEIKLMQHLAFECLIPIEGWYTNTLPIWHLPFAELRQKKSLELGIAKNVRV